LQRFADYSICDDLLDCAGKPAGIVAEKTDVNLWTIGIEK